MCTCRRNDVVGNFGAVGVICGSVPKDLSGECVSKSILMQQYECKQALGLLQRFPTAQFRSGWVQQQIGHAHFELCEYNAVGLVRIEAFMVRPRSSLRTCGSSNRIAWKDSKCTRPHCGIYKRMWSCATLREMSQTLSDFPVPSGAAWAIALAGKRNMNRL